MLDADDVAGYSADYYYNLQYIAHDEQDHVELLTGALKKAGVTPVEACTYSFPYTDPKSFLGFSSILEGVGTSAYLGAAPLVTSKDYLAVAGSILVTEAVHTSLQRYTSGEIAAANPYGTVSDTQSDSIAHTDLLVQALDPTSAYTIAAAFIKSCPASNPPLPFKAYPALTVETKPSETESPPEMHQRRDWGHGGDWKPEQGSWKPAEPTEVYPSPCEGEDIMVSTEMDIPKGSYITIVSGLTVVSVMGEYSGENHTSYRAIPTNTNVRTGKSASFKIPEGVSGQSYVFVTNKDVEGTFDSKAVVAGPAIIEVKPEAPTLDYKEE